jgi:hypothetical protein
MNRSLNELHTLEDNFDEEGAIAPTNKTIDRAVEYVVYMQEFVRQEKSITLGEPVYGPAEGGSVDAFWSVEDKYVVLLNVSPETSENPKYFGRFPDESELREELKNITEHSE